MEVKDRRVFSLMVLIGLVTVGFALEVNGQPIDCNWTDDDCGNVTLQQLPSYQNNCDKWLVERYTCAWPCENTGDAKCSGHYCVGFQDRCLKKATTTTAATKTTTEKVITTTMTPAPNPPVSSPNTIEPVTRVPDAVMSYMYSNVVQTIMMVLLLIIMVLLILIWRKSQPAGHEEGAPAKPANIFARIRDKFRSSKRSKDLKTGDAHYTKEDGEDDIVSLLSDAAKAESEVDERDDLSDLVQRTVVHRKPRYKRSVSEGCYTSYSERIAAEDADLEGGGVYNTHQKAKINFSQNSATPSEVVRRWKAEHEQKC